MPEHIVHSFPIVLTKRYGVTVNLLNTVSFLRDHGVSFEEIAKLYKEKHCLRYETFKLCYHSVLVSIKQRMPHLFDAQVPKHFFGFADHDYYAGHHAGGIVCMASLFVLFVLCARKQHPTLFAQSLVRDEVTACALRLSFFTGDMHSRSCRRTLIHLLSSMLSFSQRTTTSCSICVNTTVNNPRWTSWFSR